MAADVLCDRVHGDVCTKFGRILQNRRHECIVYGKQGTLLFAKFRDTGNICALERRIGWTLDPDDPCVRFDLLLHLAEVRHVCVLKFDSRVVLLDVGEEALHACVNVIYAKQVVTLLEHREHGYNGGQTRIEGETVLGIFQTCHHFLEGHCRRVATSPVIEA